MANNPSSSTMKHRQEAEESKAAVGVSYHHHRHGGGDDRGAGGCSASPSSAVVCSYQNNNGKKASASAVSGGVLESCYSNNTASTTTSTTRFQANLHGISMDWTPEEQAILDEGLKTYATESNIVRYAKIAVLLKNKTVRDVALRYKWMMKRDISRRRKDDLSLRKSKERKEKVINPSAKSSQAMMQPGFFAIDGVTGELLRQNARAFEQISANLVTYQIHNNIHLFCQARDNISHILKRMNEPPYVMKQMPVLPVKVNEELASSILPQSGLPMP